MGRGTAHGVIQLTGHPAGRSTCNAVFDHQEVAMADKSPQKQNAKKQGKTLKEKRELKKAKKSGKRIGA